MTFATPLRLDPLTWFCELLVGIFCVHLLQLVCGASAALLMRLPQSLLPVQLLLSLFITFQCAVVARGVFDPVAHMAGTVISGVTLTFYTPLQMTHFLYKHARGEQVPCTLELIARVAIPAAAARRGHPPQRGAHQAMAGGACIAGATITGPLLLHLHERTGGGALFSMCAGVYVACVAEGVLRLTSAFMALAFGFESAAPFEKPLLATSLADFWARRWNASIGNALRGGVYEPLTKGWGVPRAPAVVATFGVSGVCHEVLLRYCGFGNSRGEWFTFFGLHGVLVVLEKYVDSVAQKKWGRARYVVTVGVMWATVHWLFLPVVFRVGFAQRGIKVLDALPLLVTQLAQRWTP